MTRRHLLADVIIQSAGLIAALIGGSVLLIVAARTGSGKDTAAVAVYGLSLLAMFAFSILNAVIRRPSLKSRIRALDHAAIYLLIAGTYTPFCLLAIGGRMGILLLTGIWLAAALGMAARLVFRQYFEKVRILLYVAMGWSGLLALDNIADHLSLTASLLLIGGGVIYTAGAPVHRLERLPYHSAIWHACVVAAAALHYGAIMLALKGPPV